MTRRYWIIIVLCILFNIACGISAPLIPTNTDIAPTANMEKVIVTSTPKVSIYCFGIVQVDRLNLRSAPDYTSPADGAGLVKFQVVTILEFTEKWYYVETSDGRTGYARAEYVKSCR
jgi:hypothetical protein